MKIVWYLFALVATAMSESNIELLKTANDNFTANMFQEVVKIQRDKSFVQSAFSVLSPLAQLSLGSVEKTHDEILAAIGFSNDNIIKEVFADVNNRLKLIKGVELEQANKIYIRDEFELDKNFATSSKHVFESEIQNIDFQQKEKAVNEINTWVEDHTNKHIKDLISTDSIDESTVAILVNAVYFKGKWKKPFDKNATADQGFHVTKDKTISIPMMFQNNDFKYAESKELDAKFLEMEYEGGDTSLVVALPNEIDGINSLIEKIKDVTTLNKVLANMSNESVEVILPTFKIETTIDLKEVLEKMNIKTLFQAGAARLDYFLKQSKELYVGEATQKAFIEVNEEGAEAAAANLFLLATTIIQDSNLQENVAVATFTSELLADALMDTNSTYNISTFMTMVPIAQLSLPSNKT